MKLIIDPSEEPLLDDLRDLIDAARSRAAIAVNAEMTLLYWQVGFRIHDHVLQGERAAYGKQVITGLARALSAEFGRGGAPRIYVIVSASRRLFRPRRISPQCGDN